MAVASAWQRWQVVDVTTGEPVALTDVVDEASLLDAVRARHPSALGAATTWTEAVEALEAALDRDELPVLDAFAFVDWREDDGTTEIELPMRDPASNPDWRLRVRPRRWFRQHLRAAARGEGHFLADGVIPAL